MAVEAHCLLIEKDDKFSFQMLNIYRLSKHNKRYVSRGNCVHSKFSYNYKESQDKFLPQKSLSCTTLVSIKKIALRCKRKIDLIYLHRVSF